MPNLTVTLLGRMNSEDDMVQLLKPLAESVSLHWRRPQLLFEHLGFVTLDCTMTVPPGSVPLLHGRGDCEFRISGALKKNAVEETGFTLTVESSLEFADGTSQRTDFSYQRAYSTRQT
jgi:hypothetical protein